MTGTSPSYWRKAISRGAIATVRLGRAMRIAENELSRYVWVGTRPCSQAVVAPLRPPRNGVEAE
jgi:hypothetical protein